LVVLGCCGWAGTVVVMEGELVLATDVPVSAAATVMLLRDSVDGLEVFMVQRNLQAAFARGQYVFPGGRVDEADHGADFEPICDGLDDPAASQLLGVASGGLAWLVAAIRECFEEAGVLLARPSDADAVVRFDDPDLAQRCNAARSEIHDGRRTLVELCIAEDLMLLTDRLVFVAHWLTPLGERRRFDTRFFVAEAPASQVPLHDDGETIASLWVRPEAALEMWAAKQIQMFPPTVACLRSLAEHATVAGALAALRAIERPVMIEPRLVLDGEGRIRGVRVPGDVDFESTPMQQFVVGQPR
jgi:8-oxo-dGTP pyrophosphatase MutT (NUDIX family)